MMDGSSVKGRKREDASTAASTSSRQQESKAVVNQQPQQPLPTSSKHTKSSVPTRTSQEGLSHSGAAAAAAAQKTSHHSHQEKTTRRAEPRVPTRGSNSKEGSSHVADASGAGGQATSHHSHQYSLKDPVASSSSSLSDQVLASALAGTLEFLKLAGGLTLTATGKVVAPPLYVTRTIILPQLWAATVDLLTQFTPQRLHDWFRIVQSAFVQFVNVLTTTEQGYEFRHRLILWLGDLVDIVSSSGTRQVLVDSTASMVKLAQALHTPEFLAFLKQTSVLACHGLEVLSSGRVRRAVCDFQQLTWSACALWADPQTIAALAEVTAYLCYALEMEDAILDGSSEENIKSAKKDAAKRRKERDAYQKDTYQDRSLLTDPQTTVEEAILSSLGCSTTMTPISKLSGEEIDESSQDEGSQDGSAAEEKDLLLGGGSETSSIRQQVVKQYSSPEKDNKKDSRLWDTARRNVDVDYLKQSIDRQPATRVANTISYQKADAVHGDVPTAVVQDLEDVASPVLPKRGLRTSRKKAPSRKRTIVQVETLADQSDDDENDLASPPSSPKPPALKNDKESMAPPERSALPKYKVEENESLTGYFHRVLNELLAQKRAQGVEMMLQSAISSPESASHFPRPGIVRSTASSMDSMRNRLDALRFELSHQSQRTQNEGWPNNKTVDPATGNYFTWVSKNRRVAWLLLAAILAMGGTWFGLGCYGIYSLLHQPATRTYITTPVDGHATTTRPGNEIVIRIVREVVHLDGTGKVLGRSDDDGHSFRPLKQDQIDHISQCIAQAV